MKKGGKWGSEIKDLTLDIDSQCYTAAISLIIHIENGTPTEMWQSRCVVHLAQLQDPSINDLPTFKHFELFELPLEDSMTIS